MDQNLIAEVEESYARHRGFKHPFWDWMAQGKYSLPTLRRFALCYYEHVKVYRKYLAGLLTIAPTEPLQLALAEILADEFGLDVAHTPSHPAMFRDFMISLNLTASDWDKSYLIPGVEHFQQVHFSMFRGNQFEEFVGAIAFACERTTPYRHRKVVEGLRTFAACEGMKVDSRFFTSHMEIDSEHTAKLLAASRPWLANDGARSRMIAGIEKSFDARERFLDDLMRRLETQFDGHSESADAVHETKLMK